MTEELKLYCGCSEKVVTAVWSFVSPTGACYNVHLLCGKPKAEPFGLTYRELEMLSCPCGEVDFERAPGGHVKACPVQVVWMRDLVRRRLDTAQLQTLPTHYGTVQWSMVSNWVPVTKQQLRDTETLTAFVEGRLVDSLLQVAQEKIDNELLTGEMFK